jgi:hypothetical protein
METLVRCKGIFCWIPLLRKDHLKWRTLSAIPAALASAETKKKGTAVVLLYLEHLQRNDE